MQNEFDIGKFARFSHSFFPYLFVQLLGPGNATSKFKWNPDEHPSRSLIINYILQTRVSFLSFQLSPVQ